MREQVRNAANPPPPKKKKKKHKTQKKDNNNNPKKRLAPQVNGPEWSDRSGCGAHVVGSMLGPGGLLSMLWRQARHLRRTPDFLWPSRWRQMRLSPGT